MGQMTDVSSLARKNFLSLQVPNLTDFMHLSKLLLFVLVVFSTNALSAKAPLFTNKEYLNHPPRIIRTCCAFGTDLRGQSVRLLWKKEHIQMMGVENA